MVLSWAAVYTALPQRLAGTASQYSKNAMPQLATIASGSQLSLNLRWPYHAKVMKTLEANNIRSGNIFGEIVGMNVLSIATLAQARSLSPHRYHLISKLGKPKQPGQPIFKN